MLIAGSIFWLAVRDRTAASEDGDHHIADGGSSETDHDVLNLVCLTQKSVSLAHDNFRGMTIAVLTADESIVADRQFSFQNDPNSGLATDGIESISFADWTIWDRDQITSEADFIPSHVTGTDGGDEVHSNFLNSSIDGFDISLPLNSSMAASVPFSPGAAENDEIPAYQFHDLDPTSTRPHLVLTGIERSASQAIKILAAYGPIQGLSRPYHEECAYQA
jgi:hypothetical protein